METKNPGVDKALQKLKHYCAYQERSHREVKEKLYAIGMYKSQVEEIISQLIEGNYLNEERYAIAFAGGKFRQLQWGKVKIRYELKQNGISEYCIKKAIKMIADEDYYHTLNKLYLKKKQSLKSEKNVFTKKAKLYAYLAQKGFEPGEINQVMNKDE